MSLFYHPATRCARQLVCQSHAIRQITRTLVCATPRADPQWTITSPQPAAPVSVCHRTYAKGKGKVKKEKKGGKLAKIELSDEDIDGMIDLQELRGDMQKILDDLKHEYIHSLSLAVTTGLFDQLQVTTEDGKFPLNHIAQIVQKPGNLVLISLPRTPQYTQNVVEAIQNSGVNLNPQQEGTHTVFLNIPKVSRERREQLAKSAKTLCTRSKGRMQEIHGKYGKLIKKANQDKKRSLSVVDTLTKTVTDILHEHMEVADKMAKAKQDELLGDKKT